MGSTLFQSEVSMEDNNGNFLDSKTIMAIVLVAVVFFGWQSYLSHKYPNMNKPAQVATSTSMVPGSEKTAQSPAVAGQAGAVAKVPSVPDQTLKFQSDDVEFNISSRGMEINKVELKKYFDREHKNILLGSADESGFLRTGVLGDNTDLVFNITKVSDNIFQGTALTKQGVKVTKIYEVDPKKYIIKSKILLESIQSGFAGVSVSINEARAKSESSSFLMPAADIQEATVKYMGKEERIALSTAKEPVSKSFESVSVAAIGSHYFTTGIADKSEVIPEVIVTAAPNLNLVSASLNYKVPAQKDKVELSQVAYIGPKILKQLQEADSDFEMLINYGMFASIARVLLGIMKWFYSFLGNWGFSIIFLTLLVRLVVLPFNIASYKSMKKMQKIQPLMQSIRERYKDDPTSLNRETMALMKEQKVNPLGGCLPMLLQMPIFFALYQVFGQSIELYQAPFIFWIRDLSLKDPFYVLPVLMMIAMFLQQKLTPTTMDPAQAKVMQWLPIVFGFMMVALPSGLTLYIFISTIFGVVQQQVFIRDRKTSVLTKEAKAQIISVKREEKI